LKERRWFAFISVTLQGERKRERGREGGREGERKEKCYCWSWQVQVPTGSKDRSGIISAYAQYYINPSSHCTAQERSGFIS